MAESTVSADNNQSKTNFKFELENVGPISHLNLNLTDLVILFGKPNTGKSYTLKSIYAAMLPLDEVAIRSVNMPIDSKDVKNVKYTPHLQLENQWRSYNRTLVFLSLCYRSNIFAEQLLGLASNSEFLNKFTEILGNSASIDINKKSINFKLDYHVTIELHEKGLLRELQKLFYEKYKTMVPFTEKSNITINGKKLSALYEIAAASIETSGKTSFTHTLFSPSSKLNFSGLIPYTYIVREAEVETSWSELRELDNGKLSANVTINTKFPLIALSSTQEKSIVEEASNNLDKSLKTVPRSKRKTSQNIKMPTEQANLLVDALHKLLTQVRGSSIELVRSQLQQFMMAKRVRFIPFGRTILTEMLEYITREPISRAGDINTPIIRDSQGGIFYSYLNYLSQGRSLLKDIDMQYLFIPVLQGNLSIGENQSEIIYKNWDGSSVPLSLSSALAGEVTGLLLPSITLEKNDIVLIEEPEAQLHPAAQFLMALLLVALAGTRGLRVVITTHSEIILNYLAILVQMKPKPEDLTKVMKTALPSDFEERYPNIMEKFAKSVSDSIKSISLDINYFQRKGEVINMLPNEISQEIPSITDMSEHLIDWVFATEDANKH